MNIKDLQDSLEYLFKAQITPFIWGHAGIGKSSVVRQYAKEKGYHFFPLYLGTQADLGDILGLQEFVRDDKGNPIATTFAMPVWLRDAIDYCEHNPESGAIIFLDELNRARRDVLNGMFSLALDKTFHTVKLPSNCYLIAAGNPPTDEYYVTDVNETALMARFVHVKLEPTLTEWVEFAKHINMEPTLISFIQEQPQLLEEHRSSFDLPVKVDRRSYERLNKLFQLKTPEYLLKQLAGGIIGLERVVAYELHCKRQDKALTGEDVLNGVGFDKLQTWSNPGDIKATFLGVTCDNVVSTFKEIDKTKQEVPKEKHENVIKFFETIPKDLAYATCKKLLDSELTSFKNIYLNKDYEARLIKVVRAAAGIDKETK